MSAATVTLGKNKAGEPRKYSVVAQSIAYLEMELGDVFGQLQGVKTPADLAGTVTVLDADGTSEQTPAGRQGVGQLTGPAYDLLKVFIPDLMPEHEARGFATQADFDAGIRDRETARLAPTLPQVIDAFDTVFKVNRIDVVKHLGKFVPKGLLETFVKQAIGDSVSALLLSSLSESGESASTTPSEPPPTSASSPD